MTIMTPHFDVLKPKTVLAVGAHPDDIDFMASGTVAQMVKNGAKAYYLVLTDGSKGSEDREMTPRKLTEMRRQEQREGAKIIGVDDVFFLDYPDGELEITQDVKRDIVRVIRQVKPEVVITLDPTVVYAASLGMINHSDHRAAGQATVDAVYPLARDHMAFPELLAEGLEPHKAATLLLINFETTNFAVDIADVLDQKIKALTAHASQFPDMQLNQRMLTDFATTSGKRHDMAHAEAFVRIDIR